MRFKKVLVVNIVHLIPILGLLSCSDEVPQQVTEELPLYLEPLPVADSMPDLLYLPVIMEREFSAPLYPLPPLSISDETGWGHQDLGEID